MASEWRKGEALYLPIQLTSNRSPAEFACQSVFALFWISVLSLFLCKRSCLKVRCVSL